jgi:hypothetical protein
MRLREFISLLGAQRPCGRGASAPRHSFAVPL